jgi:hypothetical protein
MPSPASMNMFIEFVPIEQFVTMWTTSSFRQVKILILRSSWFVFHSFAHHLAVKQKKLNSITENRFEGIKSSIIEFIGINS